MDFTRQPFPFVTMQGANKEKAFALMAQAAKQLGAGAFQALLAEFMDSGLKKVIPNS